MSEGVYLCMSYGCYFMFLCFTLFLLYLWNLSERKVSLLSFNKSLMSSLSRLDQCLNINIVIVQMLI